MDRPRCVIFAQSIRILSYVLPTTAAFCLLLLSNLWQISQVSPHVGHSAQSMVRRQYPGVSKNPNFTAAIVALVSAHRMDEFGNALKTLESAFSGRVIYPVIAFYNEKEREAKRNALRVRFRTLVWEHIEFSFPSAYDPASNPPLVWRDRFPSYQHMCQFFFSEIMYHPVVQNFTFYMRIDTDSVFTGPFSRDPFIVMHANRYRYGYIFQVQDAHFVTEGLVEMMNSWAENHSSIVLSSRRRLVAPESYYNNFEIIHVPTFQHASFRLLSEDVKRTMRVYTHRWGDAPLRFASVAMFVDPHEIHRFCDIGYRHQTMQSLGAC